MRRERCCGWSTSRRSRRSGSTRSWPRRAEVAAALPVPSRPAPDLPEGLVLDGPFDVQGSELWASGQVQPQSRASMLVSRILAPRPGERVLDLCAAPGGKTTHLAALMEDRGEVVAVERHPGRAAALERTRARMRASCVRVEVGDAAIPRTDGPFDRILVDPPCSGLGTLQSRPDLRWRARPEAVGELAALQARILAPRRRPWPRAARSCTRCARSPAPRAGQSSSVSARAPRLRRRAAPPAAAPSRRHRRVLHRPAPPRPMSVRCS